MHAALEAPIERAERIDRRVPTGTEAGRVADALAARYAQLRARLDELGRASGRELQLVAVSKSVAPERAAELARLGQRDFGENRLEALEAKHAHFRSAGLDARWHFIGHLQRNKARAVVRLASAVHSVDSTALIATLARSAHELGRALDVYLQVNLSGEAHKSGFAPHELSAALESCVREARGAPELRLCGLMTMSATPASGSAVDLAAARALFARLSALARELPASAFAAGRARLSMGMSEDYEPAILEGADLVRIGSALFEESESRSSPVSGTGERG